MYPDKNSMPNNFTVLNWIYFFQIKERNLEGRRLFFCHFSKNVSRQKLPCQKSSVFETENNFFNQRKSMYSKEDYQHLSPFKKYIPTSKSMRKKTNVWNWIYFFSIKGTKFMWKKTINFSLLFKIVSQQKIHCQKVSAFEIEYTFSNQRKEMNWMKCLTINFCHLLKIVSRQKFHAKKFQCLKLNTLFSIKGTKCMQKKTINFFYLLKNVSRQKFHAKIFSVWNWNQFFQPMEVNVRENKVWLSIFVIFKKMDSDMYFQAKKISVFEVEYNFLFNGTNCTLKKTISFCYLSKTKFIQVKSSIPEIQCSKLIILFSNIGTKYMREKTISFCHFQKNESRQKLPCQKVSVIEVEYTFLNQRNEKYVEEDYQYLPPSKNFIPTSTISKSVSVWDWIHILNQRNEMYKKEDYQFLSLFKKMYPNPNLHAKKFQCLKVLTFFLIKGRKYMGK